MAREHVLVNRRSCRTEKPPTCYLILDCITRNVGRCTGNGAMQKKVKELGTNGAETKGKRRAGRGQRHKEKEESAHTCPCRDPWSGRGG